ncbi:MAG: Ferredoxin subunit of nitrite reductase and ring-hydroxylating dioxygenase [Pseudomonas sp.]|nr:Ferredoxin subunit of nitrite reductase and ring-hydroxylating dioxygenase [Pseudomonas sp.]
MSTRVLCRMDEVEDGGALGLPWQQNPEGMVVLRRGDSVWAYVNRCPHFSVPLNFKPQTFCTYRRKVLMCAHHSAMFRFEDGHCVDGPCKGAHLEPVPVRLVDGVVLLDIA